MAKYPDIKVECEYGAWTGWEEKQSLAIQGGNAADVMQINWNWITSYSGNGTNFANLEDYSDVPGPDPVFPRTAWTSARQTAS